jgi:hypothetical protein
MPEVHMSDKEKPLPKPPSSPFGRKKRFEKDEEDVPLMADQIAMAQAEGRLEEFLNRELPDNEHAKKLVSMMMGMTGMAQEAASQPPAAGKACSGAGSDTPPAQPPEDILNAVHAGDVRALIELLARERSKLSPHEQAEGGGDDASVEPASEKPSIEKETVDLLIGIAADNDLSLDWVIMRALRLYISDYRKSGRL